KRDV
ncbi:hypothetical protein AVEN_96430-1, partial [Araneus ventricosus]